MPRVTNRESRSYVQTMRVFKNHNDTLWGEWYEQGIPATGEIIKRYVVYSYRYTWPLFVYEPVTNTWYANMSKVSRTTSRHFSQAHPLVDMVPLRVEDMVTVARKGSVGLIESSNNLIGVEA